MSSVRDWFARMRSRRAARQAAAAEGVGIIRARLLERLDAERNGASAKIAHQSHWGEVGFIEMQAVHEIQNCIDDLPATASVKAFERVAACALENLAREWRRNPDDQDGYGVATVHAVGVLLKQYHPT